MLVYAVPGIACIIIDAWPNPPPLNKSLIYTSAGPFLLVLHRISLLTPVPFLLLKPFVSSLILSLIAQSTDESRVLTPTTIGVYICFDFAVCIHVALFKYSSERNSCQVGDLNAQNKALRHDIDRLEMFIQDLEWQLALAQQENHKNDKLRTKLRSSRGRQSISHFKGPHLETSAINGVNLGWRSWRAFRMLWRIWEFTSGLYN